MGRDGITETEITGKEGIGELIGWSNLGVYFV